MNVLVYSGAGTTAESVRHCLEALRLHLSPFYAVVLVTEAALLHEPWAAKTAMLVVPGGADLPYCLTLNGDGNRRISQFVRKGGRYMGFCAGAYYASKRCEFDVGGPLEVSGSRELGFFPGTCRGGAFNGFLYDSHRGARAALLNINTNALPETSLQILNYYNGGGVFVDAEKLAGVEVLAEYAEALDVSGGKAAAVFRRIGSGAVILTGTHPEFSAQLLKYDGNDKYRHVIDALRQPLAEQQRREFLKGCLKKLGLRVIEEVNNTIPALTPVHVVSMDRERIRKIVLDIREHLDLVNGNLWEDANDTFILNEVDNEGHVSSGIESFSGLSSNTDTYGNAALPDPNLEPKDLHFYSEGNIPATQKTPYFDIGTYFNRIQQLRGGSGATGPIGTVLGYGEVVTSTNTLMDANPGWLRLLPHGFALTATTQVSGKGRGGNVWVNPRGVMALSVLFKVPGGGSLLSIVTLQYLLGLALIELILGYGSEGSNGGGYEVLPVRLKWPNDIYALKPEYYNSLADKDDVHSTVDGDEQKWAKISGALVKSQFLDGHFHVVWGGGVNVSNEAPTTSLNAILTRMNELRVQSGHESLPLFRHEVLLAKLLHTMDQFYPVFERLGLAPFLPLYYKRWFHSDQKVNLDAGDGKFRECQIQGITPDYGLLVAKDVRTGEVLELQPDGNSFDIFKGLVYKKR